MGLERIMGYVGMDGSGFEIGAKRVESVAAKLGGNIEHHLKGAVVGAFGVAAIEEAIRRTIEFGAHINDVSKRLGMTAEKMQELRFAFTTEGGSEQGMVSFLERLSTSREKALGGNTGAISNFNRLGVNQEDLKTKRSDELMGIIGKAIEEGNIEELRAPLRAVGGKGAGELVAGFKAGIEEKSHEARAAGVIIGNETVTALKQIEERSRMLKDQLITELAPAVVTLMDRVEDFIDMLRISAAYLTAKPEESFAEVRKKSIEANGMGLLSFPNVAAIGYWLGLKSTAGDAAVAAITQQIAERRAREAAAKQNSGKPPSSGVEIPPPADDFQHNKFTSDREKAMQVDSLQKIGGFVGAGAEMQMVNIAREQLEQLKQINTNTLPKVQYGDPGETSLVDGD